MRRLLTNIGRLFTATDRGVLSDAAVLIEGDCITWVGASGSAPEAADLAGSGAGAGEPDDVEVVDVGGALVTPGLIDAHTHPVYAGDRLAEIVARSAGAAYEDVAAAGGGIPSTVTATREASLGELEDLARSRLARWLAHGTTTVEAKTGYRLERDGELGTVALLADLGTSPELPRVEITLLGAHDLHPEHEHLAEPFEACAAAVASWCAEAASLGARFVDVFCDTGYYSVEQARQVLEAGRAAGLERRLHADELAHTGASRLASEMRAASADHLLCATEEDVRALRDAGVVATLCPVTAMAMHRLPPARLLLDHGVTVALGSDHNPGQSGTTSMSLVVGLAVHVLGLSVHEALLAATAGSATSLLVPDRGTIRCGELADLVVWDTDHEGAFAWELGLSPRQVWKGGRPCPTHY